ncbi:MAG: YggS family pyridoxal phosphate-dependent enzyme [Clostridia bacterium]|nr:YggS family pyridoxal phosphate-dependent enzyme [Clostridia bacterium]
MMEKSLVEQRFYNIDENLKRIRYNIEETAVKSGRNPSDIKLMAVTKTVEPIFINHAIENGINLIGENKVQELMSKREELKLENCDVQIIGHLQTNKVKQVIPYVSMIQSVDSVRLANEISKQSQKVGKTMEILLEVNVGNEQSKSGFEVCAVHDACCEIAKLESIKIKGLMAIPPICDNNAKRDIFFSNMSKLFIDIRDKKLDNVNMDILSMGMSDDYTEAIMEGSNLVRIGSALFGARVYN